MFNDCCKKKVEQEQADLVEIIGLSDIFTKIMNGELEITKKQAEVLGKFFHVHASLFILE